MRAIARFFIENHKLSIVLTLAMLIFGVQGLRKMNAESFPSVAFAMATVITPYDGASAEDIETKITKKIEDQIRTVSGLKDVRSVSQSGLSSIFIRADLDNINVKEVMADLQRAIDRVSDLPSDLKDDPIFTEIKSEEFPAIEIAITGDNAQRTRDYIADHLKDDLEDNPLVKDVRLTGFAKRQFMVYLDTEKLNEAHIGVNEVLAKIGSRNANIPGGSLKEDSKQQLVRIEGKIQNAAELGNILIRSNFSGKKVFLKDIARIEDTEEEITTIASYNGEDATLLIVNKKGGADTIKLVKGVMDTLDSYKKLHGDKVQFHIYNNESTKVEEKLAVLYSNAAQGLALVVVFLFIFLPGRIGLMASLSLPVAVFATLGFMPIAGATMNAITILALVIALGMLVDNSVVVSENYTRLLHSGMTKLDAAIESVGQLWIPITGTAFTTIAAFLPMLVTKGIMGQFIRYIPIIVTISLLVSLFESFIFLPMRLVHFGGDIKNVGDQQDWFSKFQTKFESLMKWCVAKRYIVLGIFTGTLIFSLFLVIKANKFILFPAEQTEAYVARLELDNGTQVKTTAHYIEEVSKEMKRVLGDDALHLVGRAGTSKTDMGDPKAQDGNNVGMIILRVSEHAKLHRLHTEILEKLREIKIPGLKSLSFEALINGPPVGNAVEATFRSNSKDELDQMLAKITAELSTVNGILDVKVNDIIGDDEVYVHVDHVKADQLGLTLRSIGDTIRTAVAGKIVSDVTLDNKEVDLMVRFKQDYRKNLVDLAKVEVMDGQGNLVPISQVAQFETKQGTPQIKRYDFKRSKTLTANIDETKITSIEANKKLQDIYLSSSLENPSVSLVFGGAAESTKESMDSLFDALVLSLIGIFALLVFLFRSYLRPAIIMSTIPLGLLGFAVAFFLHQRPISFLALIGIIGLGGIIVNSGIVLISFIDDLRKEGNLSLDEILVKASGLRLRAVLVTSLTTISGLIPTAYGIGGNDAMLIPMTLAMSWGLTSGTFLTLIWIPPAYAILEDWVSLMERVFSFKKNKKVNKSFEQPASAK
jgi:multidrug efflux pump subunit AcrB